MLEFMILKAVMKARTQDFSCRQNQFHIKLPLEARELIRASQTAVTIRTKYKKNHLKGGRTGRHGRQPACCKGNSWFNSNTKRKHTGNGCRNGLPRRNAEILPGYVTTEWRRPKTGWNQQPQPAWRKMLTGDKGNKVFAMQVEEAVWSTGLSLLHGGIQALAGWGPYQPGVEW